MERLKMNILGMCGVRWTGAGKITPDQYMIIYSGGENYEKGVGIILDEEHAKTLKGYWAISDMVRLIKLHARPFDINALTADSSDEQIDKLYDELEAALRQYKSMENTISKGDFNAKVGKTRANNNIGAYAIGQRNDRGDRLAAWATDKDYILCNTIFK